MEEIKKLKQKVTEYYDGDFDFFGQELEEVLNCHYYGDCDGDLIKFIIAAINNSTFPEDISK